MNNDKKYSQKNMDRPITLAELQCMAKGILIDIPSQIEGENIKVKVKRLDMTKDFLTKPEVTNFLSIPVIDKYKNNQNSEDLNKKIEEEVLSQIQNGNNEYIDKMIPLIEDICKKTLMEPTYEDFENTIALTLEQKMFIFNWAVGETTQLINFRKG